jgi:hypothetical protein
MRQMVQNLYRTLLIVAVCLVGLAVIQHCVGLRTVGLW